MFCAMVVPVLLVAVDMVSDGEVLITMVKHVDMLGILSGNNTGQNNSTGNVTEGYIRGTEEGTIIILFGISTLILILSTVTLLFSGPLSTLLCAAHTTVAMGSREQEEQDVVLPLGESMVSVSLYLSHPATLSRHDMAIQESSGEAAWQFVLQWLFYLIAVAIAVRSQVTR